MVAKALVVEHNQRATFSLGVARCNPQLGNTMEIKTANEVITEKRPLMDKLATLKTHRCKAPGETAEKIGNQSPDFYRGLLVGCDLFEQTIKALPGVFQAALLEEIHCVMHAQIYAMEQLDAQAEVEFPDSISL